MARVGVSEVYEVSGTGVVAVVEVLNGTIRQGDKLAVEGKVARIRAISKDRRRVPSAQENEVVNLNLGGIVTGDVMAGASYSTA